MSSTRPCVANRRACGHRREGDDLGDAVAAVLLGDVVDDAIAARDREVDVHVRQVLASRVEEALEEEAVAHRVDVRDLQAVRGDRPGGRAAARADAHAVLLREVDEVPDDEEVVREPHLLDRLELEPEPFGQLGGHRPVATSEALLAELDEVVEGVPALGHREGRQQDPPELELDVAALRHLERARHRVLEPGEVAGHLLGRLEEELVRVEAPVRRVLERVAGLDAEERLVGERVLGVEVVDVSGRDERKPGLLREGDQLRVDLVLLGEPGVLDLDVRRVAAEDLHEAVEIAGRVLRAALRERARDAAREAAGERDDALRVALEELPVDARLVVVALEVAERRELDEVRVALVRLGQQRQVRVPLRLRAAVVGDVDLAADDRLHADLPGLPEELHRACERAVVGERDGRHLEARRLRDEIRDPARPVEDRVLRMDVQVDEGRSGHGRAMLIGPRDVPDSLVCGQNRHDVESQMRRGREADAFRDLATRRSALADCLVLRTRPQLVRQGPPGVPEIGALGHALELPVRSHERPEVGIETLLLLLLEHAHVPRFGVDAELLREEESAVAKLVRGRVRRRHATAIGTRSPPYETLPSDGVATVGRLRRRASAHRHRAGSPHRRAAIPARSIPRTRGAKCAISSTPASRSSSI